MSCVGLSRFATRSVGANGRCSISIGTRDLRTTFRAFEARSRKIVAISKQHGIQDVYVYGVDELQGDRFAAIRPMYEAIHEAGAKTFVSISEQTFTSLGRGVIDLPILWGPSVHPEHVAQLRASGVRPWKYSAPQAGLEEPETYRNEYGVTLFATGFSGACDYQYQRHSWNDFDDRRGRMHTMAYPTMTKPLPTLEWEGWRTAVDDVRYVSYLKMIGKLREDWLKNECLPSGSRCRTATLALLRTQEPSGVARRP